MSVSFQRQMELIVDKTMKRFGELSRNVNDHVGRSIIHGSPTTGAPGQPIDEGELILSWRNEPIARYANRWISRKPYAQIIEDNRRGAVLRSKVGGFHSVKLTRAGYRNIVHYELSRLPNIPLRFDASVGRFRDPRGRFSAGP